MTSGKIAVIGLGLIGGSTAAAARRSGHAVTGFDQSKQRAACALALGLVDEIVDGIEQLESVGVVVLAVPLGSVIELLPRVAVATGLEALVLDTASVKAPVVTAMAALPQGERAVGGHPLAGKEASGPEGADADLFAGKGFVLTPSDRTSADALASAEKFVRDLGAIPYVVDASTHDRILAETSHLPQILSSLLALTVPTAERRLSGPAFADMTRLAASDPAMWSEILLANRENVLNAGRAYARELLDLIEYLEAGDRYGVERMLERARSKARAEIAV